MHPLIPYFEPPKIPIYGNFAIHGFGILVALGFVFGTKVMMKKAERDGLRADILNGVVTWVVIGVFVGGHLGHLLLYYPEQLVENPMVIFQVWHGLSSFGGFIASAIFVYLFLRSEDRKIVKENRRRHQAGEPLLPRIDVPAYADAMMFGFTLGWFFGRMGCFVAHDHPGPPTNFWLGVYGMCPELGRDVACHDMGLYEAFWALAMFLVLRALDKKPRFPGFFLAVTLMSYGPVRLVMDVFRDPATDTRYFGFTPAQYGSVVLFFIGLAVWRRNRGRPPVRPVAVEGRAEAG